MMQESRKPTAKVTANALGAAVALIVLWAVQAFTEVSVPVGLEGAITLVVGTLAAYFKVEPSTPPEGSAE